MLCMPTGRSLTMMHFEHCRRCSQEKGMSVSEPTGLRRAAMQWLHHRTADGQEVLTRDDIADFHYLGEPFRLIEAMRGIWRPRGFEYALAIRTTYTRPGDIPPYEDEIGHDGLIKYAWYKDDP